MDPLHLESFKNVSRETSEKLLQFERLVLKWNPTINLISKATVEQIRSRHIMDSVQVYHLVDVHAGLWCDIGSGGGFPGLVCAILAKGTGGVQSFRLVESDARKAVFLSEAARTLGLDVKVLNQRIEDLPAQKAAILTARALAPLHKLCDYAQKHLKEDGIAIFPKGASHDVEVQEAQKSWRFDLETHQSVTDPGAAILVLRNICHV